MDNLCHTLVGAALAQADLKRRTRYGMATLLIGANLPDVDALAYVWGGGLTALSFRRGWTHGVLALAVLPWVLTGLVWAWHQVLGRRKTGGTTLHLDQVALLALVSVLTHPALDYMNTYGMRWLMPFVNRWYYADGLFIVDPWIWVVLGAGVLVSRARDRERGGGSGRLPADGRRPAVVALGVVVAYAAAMVAASAMARRLVQGELVAAGQRPVRVLASPVPLNPFRRAIVIEGGDAYRFGTVNWLGRPAFTLDSLVVPVNRDAPEAQAAAATAEGRAFLGWARFPFFVFDRTQRSPVVHIVDARYTLDPDAGFGAVTIGR